MAFTNVRNYATASSTSSSSTLQIFRPGTTVPAGSFLMLAVTSDNISTSSGETNNILSVTDTSGYSWTKLRERTYSTGGVSGDGVCHAVFMLKVTSGTYPSGGSVTINFSSNVTAKSGIIREFTYSGSAEPYVADEDFATILNGDAPSISLSSLTSAEYLWYRSIGSERNTTGLTTTTDFTAGGAVAANTGTLGTSVATVTEFRIATATSMTSNPGHGDSDQLGLFFAISDTPVQTQLFPPQTFLPPDGRKTYSRKHARYSNRAYDFSFVRGAVDDSTVETLRGTSRTITDLPQERRRPWHVSNLNHSSAPLQGDVDTSTPSQTGVRRTELPPVGRKLKMWGMAGWMNRDNHMAASAHHHSLAPHGPIRIDYRGIQTHTLFEDSFELTGGRNFYDVPYGPERNDLFSGWRDAPLSADSVEARYMRHFEVPLRKDRNTPIYDGYLSPPVGPDTDEIITLWAHLYPTGLDGSRWIRDGFQEFGVVMRDENGTLVEYRGTDAITDNYPTRRDRNSYDGFTMGPPFDDVTDATTGYQFDALPPPGADTRDYAGWQNRSDFFSLTEDAVAGYIATDLPVSGRVDNVPQDAYFGFTDFQQPEDFVPVVGKIWRPIYRPRRR